MKHVLRTLFVATLIGFLGSPAGAEDEAADAAAEAPSPLADLEEKSFEGESEPGNPLEYLRSFRDWLAKHEEPPPRTRHDTALWDIWRAALRPRATRMRKRVESLMQRKHWLPEDGEPQSVRPESWSRFIREVAGLMTELDGAWKQYLRARIRFKRGIPAERLRPAGSYYGYALGARQWWNVLRTRRLFARRHVLGVRLGPVVVRSYWHLMHRYRAGWLWRLHHCVGCEARRLAAQRKKAEEYIAERQRIFDTTRDTLEQQMLSLRVLVAAMQAQAEDHLGELLEARVEGVNERSPVAATLLSLRAARLSAEQYTGESSAGYGQLLRGWVRIYNEAASQLKE